jgi:magnesium chelatase subunit I
VARELVRAAVARVFEARSSGLDTRSIVAWFENGGTLDLSDTGSADALLDAVGDIDQFDEALAAFQSASAPAPVRAAAADFILEGLCALRKISRTEGGQLFASPPAPRTRERVHDPRSIEALMAEDDDDDQPRGRRKKTYN